MASTAASSAPDLALTARRFHALSDPTRLAILASLRNGECCVCDLQSALEAAQSRLSFHLRVLKDAGLVTDRKDGRWSWYQLVPHAVDELHEALDALRPGFGRFEPAREPSRTLLPLAPSAAVQADGCCG